MTQKLTPEVVVQLNDLPGFPARPNTTPPAPDRWILGDWLVECHVHPEAANFASLPLIDNLVGDVRVSLADQAWYIWDGAVWQPMAGGGGGVVSVGALAPISSTGGANPVISLNNSGVVAATYGNATTVPQIAVDAKGRITSASNVAITFPPTPATVDVTATAQENLLAGDLVRFVNDTGTPKAQKADATNTDARLNPTGFAVAAALAGAAVTVRVAGVADVPAARFDVAPAAANVGQRVFVSTTAGKVTLTAPSASGDVVQRAGVLVDGGANPKVLVQIGDPTLL
jgi:hypothetical protein